MPLSALLLSTTLAASTTVYLKLNTITVRNQLGSAITNPLKTFACQQQYSIYYNRQAKVIYSLGVKTQFASVTINGKTVALKPNGISGLLYFMNTQVQNLPGIQRAVFDMTTQQTERMTEVSGPLNGTTDSCWISSKLYNT